MALEVIASVTLAASVISCIATGLVLISFIIYRRQFFNFRQALVLNLAVADFMNSLNNSISGIIFVKTGELRAGTPCTVNGLIGQLSVQASDFSIFAIALVILLTVTRRAYMPTASKTAKISICLSVWVLPVITSVIPSVMDEMVPVGGNWCWISVDRSDLRYGMTYVWRFLVIFCTIAIYVFIWMYLRCHVYPTSSKQKSSYNSSGADSQGSVWSRLKRSPSLWINKDEEANIGDSSGQQDGTGVKGKRSDERRLTAQDFDMIEIEGCTNPKRHRGNRHSELPPVVAPARASTILKATPALILTRELHSDANANANGQPVTPNEANEAADGEINVLHTNNSEFPIRHDARQVEREISRMMLLNAYPFLYVLLWIPGVVNRLMQASGNAPSPEVSAALQVSTQFVGLANALTYGFNHYLRDRLKGIYLTPFIARFRSQRR